MILRFDQSPKCVLTCSLQPISISVHFSYFHPLDEHQNLHMPNQNNVKGMSYIAHLSTKQALNIRTDILTLFNALLFLSIHIFHQRQNGATVHIILSYLLSLLYKDQQRIQAYNHVYAMLSIPIPTTAQQHHNIATKNGHSNPDPHIHKHPFAFCLDDSQLRPMQRQPLISGTNQSSIQDYTHYQARVLSSNQVLTQYSPFIFKSHNILSGLSHQAFRR